VAGIDKEVCSVALANIFGITQSCLRWKRKHLAYEEHSSKDMSGKHGNRPQKMKPEILDAVQKHISSFPARRSHCTQRNNREKVFLPENLNIRKMHQMFLADTGKPCTCKLYYSVFCNEFNISFAYPRADTCSQCDECNTKLKAATQEEAHRLTVQRNLHQAFYDLKKHVKLHCQSSANVFAIAFSFMQNLLVPNMTMNKMFYSRQAWHYVFSIHNIGTCEVVMYTHHEGEGTLGQNDVTSVLLIILKTICRQIDQNCGCFQMVAQDKIKTA
jgi:hypothetical protein